MTTDTRAVARWDRSYEDMQEYVHGDYVLFTDHERVVGDLGKDVKDALYAADVQRIAAETLRTALAASRAEAEGLKKDAERYRWLKDNCQAVADEHSTAGQLYFGTYLYGNIDSAIDAAMEKGNV